jgi:hypothetical protein
MPTWIKARRIRKHRARGQSEQCGVCRKNPARSEYIKKTDYFGKTLPFDGFKKIPGAESCLRDYYNTKSADTEPACQAHCLSYKSFIASTIILHGPPTLAVQSVAVQ